MSDAAPTTAPEQATSGLSLRQLQAQVAQAKLSAAHLVDGLSDQAFQWRPGPERWSIAECFEHLNVTLERYLPGIDRAIENARSRSWQGDGFVRPGFLGRWMIKTLEPPATRRFKAPGAFQPQRILPLAEALPRFTSLREELEKRMQNAAGLDLQRAKTRSPALPLLRFSLGETFVIMTTHDRRHLWQAEQVKQSAGFPGR